MVNRSRIEKKEIHPPEIPTDPIWRSTSWSKQGIEYPDEDGKGSGQHQFSQEIGNRQVTEDDEEKRVDQKRNER